MDELIARIPPDLRDAIVRYGTDPLLLVGALGAVLLLAGARVYWLVVMSPGIAGGLVAGLELTRGMDGKWQMAAALSLALIGGLLFRFVERLAIAGAGSFVAVGAARAGAPLLLDGATPWYVLVAAGLLGALLLPRLYRRLLPVLTPAVGALCVAWALERPTDLLLIGGLTLGGVVVQLATRSGGGGD